MIKPDMPSLQCAITAEPLEKEWAIKLVMSPQGVVVPDLDDALPGKALWAVCKPSIWRELLKEEVLERLFGKEAVLLPNFEQRCITMMRQQALQWLALSKKAGKLIVGGQKVKVALNEGRVLLVFQAAGGSKRELKNLLQGPYKSISVCDFFTTDELAGVLGQNHIGYLALLKGGLSEKVFRRCIQLVEIEQEAPIEEKR